MYARFLLITFLGLVVTLIGTQAGAQVPVLNDPVTVHALVSNEGAGWLAR